MTKYLEIGQIVNTFGVKGMMKIVPFTDDVRRIDNLETIYIEEQGVKKEYRIEEVKYHKNLVLLKLNGIDTMDSAEELKQCYIYIDREKEEPLEEGIYYIVDLIGLEVYTDDGNLLGNVEDIYNTGSNDIYVVKNKEKKEILLPGIADVIKKVDLENKKIIVHLIPGLI